MKSKTWNFIAVSTIFCNVIIIIVGTAAFIFECRKAMEHPTFFKLGLLIISGIFLCGTIFIGGYNTYISSLKLFEKNENNDQS